MVWPEFSSRETWFKNPVVQRKYNTRGVKTRWDFLLGDFLMVDAVMSFTGLSFMEAVSGGQWRYTKT